MVALDPVLGGIAVASFPVVLLLTRWFRDQAERAYRATRDAIALVIVHFTESLSGIRAVQAFRRQSRNQAIFDDLDDRFRAANADSGRVLESLESALRVGQGRDYLALDLNTRFFFGHAGSSVEWFSPPASQPTSGLLVA